MLQEIIKKLHFLIGKCNFPHVENFIFIKQVFSNAEIIFLEKNLFYKSVSKTLCTKSDFIRDNKTPSKQTHTLVFENLQKNHHSIAQPICIELIKTYGENVFLSVFNSNKKSETLGLHEDEWSNIVIQLKGAKQWDVYDKNGAKEILLITKGDVLLIPNRAPHEVFCRADISIHVSIGFIKNG
jgi:ribosomal protein L16 Arg81 hydroxylase